MKEWLVNLTVTAIISVIAEAALPEGELASSVARVISLLLMITTVMPIVEMIT